MAILGFFLDKAFKTCASVLPPSREESLPKCPGVDEPPEGDFTSKQDPSFITFSCISLCFSRELGSRTFRMISSYPYIPAWPLNLPQPWIQNIPFCSFPNMMPRSFWPPWPCSASGWVFPNPTVCSPGKGFISNPLIFLPYFGKSPIPTNNFCS